MQRSSVDFPEPEGPRTQNTEPRGNSMSTPRSTSSLPNRLWTPSSRSIGPSGSEAASAPLMSARPRTHRGAAARGRERLQGAQVASAPATTRLRLLAGD
jgi:hypothetical protein